MEGPVVKVSGLVKKYDGAAAVDGLSFEIAKGETLALLGPNGAGKTTTVEIVEGVRSPTEGTISVFGVDVTNVGRRKDASRIGTLPQEFNAFPRLTVSEILAFFNSIYGRTESEADEIKRFQLGEVARVRFSALSLGQKRRLGLAVALLNDPDLILLDEPTAGLDPEAKRKAWEALRTLKSEGKTLLLTTHNMEEAEILADRIGILVKGKLVALDTPAELVRRLGGSKSIVFKSGGDAVFGTLRRFFETAAMEGQDVVLPFENLRDLEVALNALVGRGLNVDIGLRTPSLEDVYLSLSGGDEVTGP